MLTKQERKLIAHFHRRDKITEFDTHARAQGFSRAAAAKLIFERELHDDWLANAFAWTPTKPPEGRGS